MTSIPPAAEADEIDLRAWVQALARAWKVIVGLTVVGLVASGAYTLLQPRVYESSALVVAVPPPGGPSGQTGQDVRGTVLEVAQSEGLVSDLYELVGSQLRTIRDRGALRGAIEATAGRDPRTVRLTVRSQDPAEAQAVANTWARLVVMRVDDTYSGRGRVPVSTLAQGGLGQDEVQSLYALRIRRDAAEAELKALSAALNQLSAVEPDIRAFRDQLAQGRGPAVPEDQITVLFLQLRAFGVSLPERLELSGQELGAPTRDGQALLARLDELSRAVAARKADAAARISSLRAEVDRLNGQIGPAEIRSTFSSGVGKFLSVGSWAVAPDRPAQPRPALNLAVGGVLGLAVGLALATGREVLRGPAAELLPRAGSEPVAPAAGISRQQGPAE